MQAVLVAVVVAAPGCADDGEDPAGDDTATSSPGDDDDDGADDDDDDDQSGDDLGDPDQCPPTDQQVDGCVVQSCCDADDVQWFCQCYAQCESNCCGYEAQTAGYCILSGGSYTCGAGVDQGETCAAGIEVGATCDPDATPGCCAEDLTAWNCACEGTTCVWAQEDCTTSPECR